MRHGGRESPQAQRRRADHSAHDVVGGGSEAGLQCVHDVEGRGERGGGSSESSFGFEPESISGMFVVHYFGLGLNLKKEVNKIEIRIVAVFNHHNLTLIF